MPTPDNQWTSPRGAPPVAAAPQADDLLVVLGLSSGVQLRGRLARRGAGDVLERLNNSLEAVLQLETATTRARSIVARSELAWASSAQPEVDRAGRPPLRAAASGPAGRPVVSQAVLAHVGAFAVQGTLQTYYVVDLADFLLGAAAEGRFFALVDAHITGPETDLHTSVVAINAARVAAMLALD